MTNTRTRWGYILLLLAGGVCAAMQIGKVPPALSTLREDLNLGIVAAAWVLSLFSAIGATAGALAGSIANRFGPRRTTIVGLLCMAGAGAAGAMAQNAAALLASRAIEGTAFVVVVVAIPSLLAASASPADRRFVPSMWGTYMPTGMAIALSLSPFVLLNWGWRTLWYVGAALLVLIALVLLIVRSPAVERGGQPAFSMAAVQSTLKHREAWLLSLIFLCYTFQYLSVLGFLPTILQEQGIAPQAAGTQTAIAVIANAGGNLAASWLIARHIAPSRLMVAASLVMSGTVLGIFSPEASPATRYWLAVVFSGFGGLLPAAIFATVPAVARGANSGAMTMGLVVQASHIGQMIGPPVIAAIALATGGWAASPLALIPAAAIALIAALSLRTARTATLMETSR